MIRLSIIILNIATKALHGHLNNLIKVNKFKDVESLVKHVSEKKPLIYSDLIKHCDNNIPNSVKEFDITKSVALIQNVFKKMFKYDSGKFVYCELLRNIRNKKYAHIKMFEMDDIDFSATVVKIEEIIRQLCDYDKDTFLNQIEVELGKESYNINELKPMVSEMLAGMKKELELFNSKIASIIDEIAEKVEAKGNEVTEKVEAKGNEVTEKVEAKGNEVAEKVASQIYEVKEKLASQIYEVNEKLESRNTGLFKIKI